MEVIKGETAKAIGQALKESFEDYYIYDEPVTMGFKTPSFHISCDDVKYTKGYGTRYLVLFNVCVSCYADIVKNINKINEVRFKLMRDFNYVQIGGKKVRVNNKSFETEDRSLKFNFKLSYHVMAEKDINIMENLIEKHL